MQYQKKKQKQKNHQDFEKLNAGSDCRYKAGALCPVCGRGILDYNCMLNLVCPVCGNEFSAGFT